MEQAPAWLINGFINLAAAMLAVPAAKKLGLGAIVGDLAARTPAVGFGRYGQIVSRMLLAQGIAPTVAGGGKKS